MTAVSVVRVTDEIADALAIFLRDAWDFAGNGDDVRRGRAQAARDNPLGAGLDVPATAFLQDGRVIGYLTTIPVSFWNGATESAGHWLKGFMVLPEFRNGPVGFNVLKEMLRHISTSGIMTVAPEARRLFTAVGYRDCGVLPNYISLLRPGRVSRQLDIAALGMKVSPALLQMIRVAQRTGVASVGGAAVGIAFWAKRALNRFPRSYRLDVSGTLPTKDDLDGLWQRSRATLTSSAVRDGKWLAWRYKPAVGSTYESASVRDGEGRLVAVTIVRRPKDVSDSRLRGIRMATLSDALFPADDPVAGSAALAAAEQIARRMDADAIVCSTSHPTLISLLAGRAYVRFSGNVHLMIRDPKNALALAPDAKHWWVMRGDANSDDTF